MAMGQTSGSLASGTGMMAISLALAEVIQLVVYWLFDHASITNEQAAACATLLYPFIHLAYAKIGYDPQGAANDRPKPDAPPPASSGAPVP